MKIVVIGDTSQMGSKIVTLLKQNPTRTITAAQDRTADIVSDGSSPKQAGIPRDAGKPNPDVPGCSGKDCTRCSLCAAIGRLAVADLEIRRPDEPVAGITNHDDEARYCGVRLADLRLLPDYRAIRDASLFSERSEPFPSPRGK
jgi:hypothetical protein